MHFYPRHIGDYSTATTHLSMLEHGAYAKLLDHYYATEKPIPVDRCERIAGAYETHERDAVRSVLQQFFTLTDEGWVNPKADQIIAEFRAKSLKAKESAAARWKRMQCDGNANAYADAMLTQNSKPKREDQKQKPARAAPVFVDPPDWLDAGAWGEWCQYRKGKRWQESAQRYSINELDKLRLAGHDPAAVIRQSIAAGWTGLFPLKTNGASNGTHRPSLVERVRANAEAGERADRGQANRANGHAHAVDPHGGDLRAPLDGDFRRIDGRE